MATRTTETQHRLIVQPEEGAHPVVELIGTAQRHLRLKQFDLTDPHVLSALVHAHKRGVAVKVMVNPQRSSGTRANDESYATLRHAGLHVEWTNPKFAVTHEKSVVVDESVALISTFNLATKYFTETRDYGVLTTDAAQIAQIIQGFEADWHRKPFAPDPGSGLLWSSDNARPLMAQFIDQAHHELLIQHPKFVDVSIVERIAHARARKVRVHLLCGGKHGISDWDILDTFASLRLLRRAGVKVKRQKHLKLHAKLIIVDGERALVGSMNIDRSAFDVRRELGLVTDVPEVVTQLLKLFKYDWRHSKDYEAPDPLKPETHDEGELPHDPDFQHD